MAVGVKGSMSLTGLTTHILELSRMDLNAMQKQKDFYIEDKLYKRALPRVSWWYVSPFSMLSMTP